MWSIGELGEMGLDFCAIDLIFKVIGGLKEGLPY